MVEYVGASSTVKEEEEKKEEDRFSSIYEAVLLKLYCQQEDQERKCWQAAAAWLKNDHTK